MIVMNRYLVERTFHSETGLRLPKPDHPPDRQLAFAENNARDRVTWLYSYISPDQQRSFCMYEAPNPEAVRRASMRNGLPVDRITGVSVIAAPVPSPLGNDLADRFSSEQVHSDSPHRK